MLKISIIVKYGLPIALCGDLRESNPIDVTMA